MSYHYEAFDESNHIMQISRTGIDLLSEVRFLALYDMVRHARRHHMSLVCAIYSVGKSGVREYWYRLNDGTRGAELIKIKKPVKRKPDNLLKFMARQSRSSHDTKRAIYS